MVEITEAAIQFGLKKTNDINKLINRIKKIKSITLFYEGNKIFISDDDCQKLKRNRENNIPYSIEIPEGYLTRNEAAKKYEISYNALRQQEKNGVVKIVRVQGISLLEELSIQSLKKNIEMIKLIEKDNNWIRLSSLYKKSKKYDKVSITLNRNEFKNRVIIMKYGKKIEKFIHIALMM